MIPDFDHSLLHAEPCGTGLLGGLSLGEIPIAGSKRRAIAGSLRGSLFRIGRIPANKAFVVIRNNLRLVYASPDYNNYAYAARKVFGATSEPVDVDHALGRQLTQYYRFQYSLLTRVDRSANRSHGRRERPPVEPLAGVNLTKFCYTDERILRKVLGISASALPPEAQSAGYTIQQARRDPLSVSEAVLARRALGMADEQEILLDCLRPIAR